MPYTPISVHRLPVQWNMKSQQSRREKNWKEIAYADQNDTGHCSYSRAHFDILQHRPDTTGQAKKQQHDNGISGNFHKQQRNKYKTNPQYARSSTVFVPVFV